MTQWTESLTKHALPVIGHKRIDSDNPAGGALNAVLPRRARVKAHHRALPYVNVAAAMNAVRDSTADTATRLAFEFLVLTVAWAGEVRESDWNEIDLHTRT